MYLLANLRIAGSLTKSLLTFFFFFLSHLYCIEISALLFSQKFTSDRKIFLPFNQENYINSY